MKDKEASPAAEQPRVAVLASTSWGFGGMERTVVNLTSTFARQGYQTRCIFPRLLNSDSLLEWCRQQGVEAETTEALVRAPLARLPADVRRLRDILAPWHPTAVSLHYPSYLSLKDVLAARWAGARRCVATIHAMPDSLSARRRVTLRLASQLVDAVIVHSQRVGQAVIAAGIPARKVVALPLGVHLPESVPTKAAARARLGLPAGAFVVGSLARLVPEKGIDGLIEAMGQLPQADDGPHLLIAGDGPERDALARLAVTKLGGRARLLGQIGGEALADFYAALDVFALAPVIEEAFGLVYVEAAQFGVPSVGWRIGGVAEAVADGETGLLAAAHDLAGLGQAIARLRADTALRARLGAAAEARAITEFTETRMAQEYAKVLRLPPDTPARQDEHAAPELQLC